MPRFLLGMSLCFLLPQPSEAVNIAYMKPASMSSKYLGSDSNATNVYPEACAAVNGHVRDVLCGSEDVRRRKRAGNRLCLNMNCIKTGDDDVRPWWRVDLQRAYTIHSVEMWPEKDGWRNMANMIAQVDAQTCFVFLGYQQSVDSLRRTYSPELIGNPYKFKCITPLTGRYFTLRKKEYGQNQPHNHHLLFCEVRIYVCKNGYYGEPVHGTCRECPPVDQCQHPCNNYFGCHRRVDTNVAINKPASMSSHGRGYGLPNVAVDGSRLFDHYYYCVQSEFILDIDPAPWFRVDLQGRFDISYITLTSAAFCCVGYLDRITSYVSETLSDPNSGVQSDAKVCFDHDDHIAPGLTTRLVCSPPRAGRYVTIIMTGNRDRLVLCEMEVYGVEVRAPAVGESCTETCITSRCDPATSICKDGICRLKDGQACTGDREKFCSKDSICEDGICKPMLGKKCPWNKRDDICPYGTVCDYLQNSVCKSNYGESCTNTTDCVNSVACDATHRCRKPLGRACNVDRENICVAGAYCKAKAIQSVCTCGNGTVVDGDICAPKDGRVGARCTGNAECVPNAICRQGRCECRTGFAVSAHDLTCKVHAGGACTVAGDCSTGLKCQGSLCKIALGHVCQNSVQNCEVGTVCDRDHCRTEFGKTCKTSAPLCESRALCELSTCKLRVGQMCTDTRDCMAGTACLPISGRKLCVLKLGESCQNNTHLCSAQAVCDTDSICRLDVGKRTCSGSASRQMCRHGAVCDRGVCKLSLGTDCSGRETQCKSDAVCDITKRCKTRALKRCNWFNDSCTSGSRCTKQRCECLTNVALHNPRTGLCDPLPRKVGGVCDPTRDDPCDDHYAVCISGSNSGRSEARCECADGFAPEEDLTCKRRPGAPCDHNNKSVSCVSGTLCHLNVCQRKVGQPCDGEHEGFCTEGASCDVNGKCTTNLGGDCSYDPSNCKLGTVCDATFKCKLRARIDLCTSNNTCPAVSYCVNGTCQCRKGLSRDLSSNICGRGVGRDCTDDVDSCIVGTTCDEIKHRCSVLMGGPCNIKHMEGCVLGAVCDPKGFVCGIELNGICTGTPTGICIGGTVCDISGICRRGVNYYCDSNDTANSCVAGAVCTNFRCLCDSRVAVPMGAICVAHPGLAGGACEVLKKRCIAQFSDCVDGVCSCRTGFTTNPADFSCVPITPNAPIDDTRWQAVIGVSLSIATFSVFMLVVMKHKRRSALAFEKKTNNERMAVNELTKAASFLSLTARLFYRSERPSNASADSESSKFTDASSNSDASSTSADKAFELRGSHTSLATINTDVDAGLVT